MSLWASAIYLCQTSSEKHVETVTRLERAQAEELNLLIKVKSPNYEWGWPKSKSEAEVE